LITQRVSEKVDSILAGVRIGAPIRLASTCINTPQPERWTNSRRRAVMVTKKKSTGKKEANKGRVKVAKLTLNKESVKDLTHSQRKQIKGGAKALISASCRVC
jgi:hypothetical protein